MKIGSGCRCAFPVSFRAFTGSAMIEVGRRVAPTRAVVRRALTMVAGPQVVSRRFERRGGGVASGFGGTMFGTLGTGSLIDSVVSRRFERRGGGVTSGFGGSMFGTLGTGTLTGAISSTGVVGFRRVVCLRIGDWVVWHRFLYGKRLDF